MAVLWLCRSPEPLLSVLRLEVGPKFLCLHSPGTMTVSFPCLLEVLSAARSAETLFV